MKDGGSFLVSTFNQEYGTTALNTGTPQRIINGLGTDVNYIDVFDSSGSTIQIGYGASGSQVWANIIPPGGTTGKIACHLNKGMQVWLQALDTNAAAGENIINFYR